MGDGGALSETSEAKHGRVADVSASADTRAESTGDRDRPPGPARPGGGRPRSLGLEGAAYVVLAGFQRGVPILLLPFVTRILSATEYGAASILAAVNLFLGVVLGAALEVGVYRWGARRDDPESPALLHGGQVYVYVILPLASCLAAIGLLLVDQEIVSVHSSYWALETAAAGLLPAAGGFALPLLRATGRFSRAIVVGATTGAAAVIAKIVLLLVMDDAVLAWVVSDVLAAAVSYVVAVSLARVPATRVTRPVLRQLFGFVTPLLPHRVAFWSLSSLSRPALAVVGSLVAVALYSLALNIAAIAALVLAEVNRTVAPNYSREHFPAPTSRTHVVARMQVILAFATPAVTGALVAVGAPVLIGQEFTGALPMVGVLLLSQIAYGIYVVPMNYITYTAGRTSLSWIASTAGAVLIFAAIFRWGDSLGLQFLAWTTVAGYVVMAISAFAIAARMGLEIRWRSICPSLPNLVLACAATAASVASLFVTDYGLVLLAATTSLVITSLLLLRAYGVRTQPNSHPVPAETESM